MRPRTRNQRGVAAIEFALVLPVLILLVLGIIEFSVALYDKAVITNASREGARAGIVFGTPSLTDAEIASVVSNYCQNRLITFGSPGPVTTTIVREGTYTGDDLKVQVRYQYGFLAIPRFVVGLMGGIQLTAETIMRME
jgi:Flp pilus assembly protein TadG